MRLVPIQYVKEGCFLAQPLYNNNGQVLLYKGASLTNNLISKIKEAGFLSIYISNNNNKDQIIEDVIKPELRQKAIISIKKVYQSVACMNNKISCNQLENTISDLRSIVDNIVNDILNQKDTLIQLVDIKNIDNYTYAHSVNVGVLSLIIGISYGLNKNDLYDLTLGALLHDIGKMFVPESLIKKPNKLTEKEFKILQEHSLRGFNYMKDELNINPKSRIIALQHHERVDGTGYPYNLKGDKINLFSKITAIADVYDALTSDRVYRKAIPINEALEYIMGSCGTFFDYDLVNIFIKKVIPYPIGTLVKLSNNTIGMVVDINLDSPLRPIVKIVKENEKKCSEYIIDLTKENTIVIKDIVYNI